MKNSWIHPRGLAWASVLAATLAWGEVPPPAERGPFLVEPYLQLGSRPEPDALSLLWHGPDRDQPWAVEIRSGPGRSWVRAAPPAWVRVAVPGTDAHRVYSARLRPLAPGADFRYRVLLDGRPVFRSRARGPRAPGQGQRVVVLGDVADGHPPARDLVAAAFRQRPDLVVLPGDLVYQDGRISEYRRHFYPVFNAPPGFPGAPLLRSVPTVAALGNHDLGERGPRHPWAAEPDALAYYLYWDQPLNGPVLAPDGPNAPPLRPGPGWTWSAFLAAAGPRFPGMGTFSFDSGGVHWTVLDSNPHARWDDPSLVAWLAKDLYQARDADWRFVVFHHPAFNFSDGNRYVDQWMARIWPLLERGRADLVFTGHIHTYVRTQPIRFTPDPASLAALDPRTQQGPVLGQLAWDPAFDGHGRTRADGVIHLICGGGGAHLHLKGRTGLAPRPYVARVVSQEHSFSVLDIKGRRLEFRQLGGDGRVLDRFVLTR